MKTAVYFLYYFSVWPQAIPFTRYVMICWVLKCWVPFGSYTLTKTSVQKHMYKCMNKNVLNANCTFFPKEQGGVPVSVTTLVTTYNNKIQHVLFPK